ncbi:MAG TPA: CvpA family protein [Granulicella sp.]|jgi:membrane protein required for colicin V production|nr:CvpA family protein [Granulicella sp.]
MLGASGGDWVVDVRALNWFDWMLVAVLVYSTVAAFLRGFFREIFSLAGLVAGILLAGWNYPAVADRLSAWLGISLTTAEIAAFLLIAVLVMVGCGLVGKVLATTARTIGLGFLDRLLGAGFGFARGFLLGVAVMVAAAAFTPHSEWLQKSQLSLYFLDGAHAVSFVVPGNLQERVRVGALELKHSYPDWIKRQGQVHNIRTATKD